MKYIYHAVQTPLRKKKAIFIFILPLCIFFFIKNVCLPRPFVLKCHHHVVFTVLYITSAAPGTWTKVPASLVDQFLTHMLNNKKKKKAWLLTFFLKWCIYAVLFAYWCHIDTYYLAHIVFKRTMEVCDFVLSTVVYSWNVNVKCWRNHKRKSFHVHRP